MSVFSGLSIVQSLIGVVALFAAAFFFSRRSRVKHSHRWRIRSAAKALEKIRGFRNNGQVFTYVRKVDPFVFEEMILLAISDRDDVEVARGSNRYTGDGGVDGTFFLTSGGLQRKVLIQAKRYKSHINKQHVEAFGHVLMQKRAAFGLFVHTGRTGKASRGEATARGNIRIISGDALVRLLKYGEFSTPFPPGY